MSIYKGKRYYSKFDGDTLVEFDERDLIDGKFEIPEGVTSIGEGAFIWCPSLEGITIPSSVTSIGREAFSGGVSLQEIKIPHEVTSIGSFAFQDCEGLKEVTFESPSSVTSIGNEAFEGCLSLEKISIPKNVTSIGFFAFQDCEGLKEVTFEDSSNVTSIAYGTFSSCSSLEKINIPKSVTSIERGTFCGCKSLKEITIPEGVTNIEKLNFDSGTLLKFNNDIICFYGLYERLEGNKEEQIKKLKCSNVNKIMKRIPSEQHKNINYSDLFVFMKNLGLFEDKSKKIKLSNDQGKIVEQSVFDIASNIFQKMFFNGDKGLDLSSVHTYFQAMKPYDLNEEFLRFLSKKDNLEQIIEEEKKYNGFIVRVNEWFEERKNLENLQNSGNDYGTTILPTIEENRYKVKIYKTVDNDIDKVKWCVPTVELLVKEFKENKFKGVQTERHREIADYLSSFVLYSQKHFDKALELDQERIDKKVPDHIIGEELKQSRAESFREYLKNNPASEDKNGIEKNIFTYEMLPRSSVENFAIGFLTSCCATIYCAGAGAMRATISDENMQSMVIRDNKDKIVAFGIVYVNKEEGYAVINDFEVNGEYEGKKERKFIYEKAIQGVDAFVKKYNEKCRGKKGIKPISKVNCGISPNGTRINDFVRQNPKEEKILKAPNFENYKYNGSGNWSGDWHREQYTLATYDEVTAMYKDEIVNNVAKAEGLLEKAKKLVDKLKNKIRGGK